MGLSESKEKEVPENQTREISRGDLQSDSEEAPEMPTTKLHQTNADEEDENVKQLQECSVLYLSLQECLIKTDRNWKSCQLAVDITLLLSQLGPTYYRIYHWLGRAHNATPALKIPVGLNEMLCGMDAVTILFKVSILVVSILMVEILLPFQ